MVGLRQHSESGQLMGHGFTVLSGPTIHDPTALLPQYSERWNKSVFSLQRRPASKHLQAFRKLYPVL